MGEYGRKTESLCFGSQRGYVINASRAALSNLEYRSHTLLFTLNFIHIYTHSWFYVHTLTCVFFPVTQDHPSASCREGRHVLDFKTALRPVLLAVVNLLC